MTRNLGESMAGTTRTRETIGSGSIEDLIARYRANRTLVRLLGFFIMAGRDLVLLDALARPLQLEAETLRGAAAILERDGFVEFDSASVQEVRCRLTPNRRSRALARQIVRSVERSVR